MAWICSVYLTTSIVWTYLEMRKFSYSKDDHAAWESEGYKVIDLSYSVMFGYKFLLWPIDMLILYWNPNQNS